MLYNEVMQHEEFYSLLYAPCSNWPIKGQLKENDIVQIKTSEIEWAKDKNEFFYVWGWPGPDANSYTKETYGKDWAYTKEELENYWKN